MVCTWIAFLSLAPWEPGETVTEEESFSDSFWLLVIMHINEELGHWQRHLHWTVGLPPERQRN